MKAISNNNNNANFSLTDEQWLQASLPNRFGGLGARSVSSLAPSAFLASAARTNSLQEMILSSIPIITDLAVSETQDHWSNLCNLNTPIGMQAYSQKTWDNLVAQTVHSELLAKSSSLQGKASLLAVSAPHSCDWLKALPISSCRMWSAPRRRGSQGSCRPSFGYHSM